MEHDAICAHISLCFGWLRVRIMAFELRLKTRLYSAVKSAAKKQSHFNSPQCSQHAPQRQGPNQG